MKREITAVGQWYLRPDTQDLFQVIDCDERSGAIRIQMFDGSLDEIDEDTWRAWSAEAVAPPEDWTGPLDNWDIDDPDEFVRDERPSEEAFRDDREPWESLLVEQAASVEAEWADLEEDEGHWASALNRHRDPSREMSRHRA